MCMLDDVLYHCPVRERIFSTLDAGRHDDLIVMAALYLGIIEVIKPTMREVLVPDYPIHEAACVATSPISNRVYEEWLGDGILPKLDLSACAHVMANIHAKVVGADELAATAPYWIRKWNMEWDTLVDSSILPLEIRDGIKAVYRDIESNDEVVEAALGKRELTKIRWSWGRELQWLNIRGILYLCTRTVEEAISRFPTSANAKIEQLIEVASRFISGEVDKLDMDFSYDEYHPYVSEYEVFTAEVSDVRNFRSKGGPRGVVAALVRCVVLLGYAARSNDLEEENQILGAYLREAGLLASHTTFDNFFEILKIDSSRFPELGAPINKK